MMQQNQMPVPTSTSEQSNQRILPSAFYFFFKVYRSQTNSPAPSNIPSTTLNKSPHGSNAGGLYPPSNPSSTNSSVPPSMQQQRSPAGSVPSPSPSGPITSSISPQNPVMNKAPTPQPPSMSQQQQRPYLPPQTMMQQQGRVMNGTGMEHSTIGQTSSSYIQGQQSYMPQQQSYAMQQNGYGHHPNGNMSQQYHSTYHQQQSKNLFNKFFF
jgi:hypothetical protein